jgi:hypothetical protein
MTQLTPLSQTITLAWGAKVSNDFARGVIAVCRDLGWGADHPSWLMACMAFETAETFSPSVCNAAGSGAVGLIQFMPATAADLGTTTENLRLLSATSQLAYVQRYFKPYAARIRSLLDMYMAILLPSAIGKADDAVLFSGGVAYRQNAGLDANRDGLITKAEASMLVQAKLLRGLQPGFIARYAGCP